MTTDAKLRPPVSFRNHDAWDSLKPSTQDVVKRIHKARPNGIHSFMLRDPELGRVHMDAPKRVSEAKAAGYDIEARTQVHNGHRGKLYRFLAEPPPEVGAGATRAGAGADPGGFTSPSELDGQGERAPAKAAQPAPPSSVQGDTTGEDALPGESLFDTADFEPPPEKPPHDLEQWEEKAA